ncbi:MAG TPA: MerR family transcriptional regulator [Frankiaceae bacterium]|nr:MerR family transcriptional regulator [Frankiaceae bacterium]
MLPEAGRTRAGYRLFGPDAVARARLIRTLRELGVGLAEVTRVLTAETSLAEIADRHADALDAQIRTLRLQRARGPGRRPYHRAGGVGAHERPDQDDR